MNCIPVEIKEKILLCLDGQSFYNAHYICQLWKDITSKYITTTDFNHIGRDGDILSLVYSNPTREELKMCVDGAACKNHISMVLLILRRDPTMIRYALVGACLYNHITLIKILVDMLDWDDGDNRILDHALVAASERGHLDLVKYLFNEGAGENLNQALSMAARNSHVDVVKYLISKGAELKEDSFQQACYGGCLEIMELLYREYYDLSYMLYWSCYNGFKHVTDWLIENGANDFSHGLRGACRNKRLDMIDYMIEKGAISCSCGLSIDDHRNKLFHEIIMNGTIVKGTDLQTFFDGIMFVMVNGDLQSSYRCTDSLHFKFNVKELYTFSGEEKRYVALYKEMKLTFDDLDFLNGIRFATTNEITLLV